MDVVKRGDVGLLSGKQWRVWWGLVDGVDRETGEVVFTVRALALRVGVNKGTVVKTLRIVERLGWVKRLSDVGRSRWRVVV